jgi:hypothetical protein
MKRMKEERVDKAAKLTRIVVIIVAAKVIGLVPVVPQNILSTFTNDHLKKKN